MTVQNDENEKINLLIVDDDDSVRVLLKEMLSTCEYNIQEAIDGEQAWNKIEKFPVNLVITDLVMPNTNGIDLIMKLRKTYPDVAILAISGGGGVTGRYDYLPVAKLLGVGDILQKPFSASDLRGKVTEILESSSYS